MNIGLRSVNGTYNMNYGSSLQCFALYSFLSKLFPNDNVLYLKQWDISQVEEQRTFEADLYGRKMNAVNDWRILDKCVFGSDCVMYFNEGTMRESDGKFFLLGCDIERVFYALGSEYAQDSISQECSSLLESVEYVSIRDIDN